MHANQHDVQPAGRTINILELRSCRGGGGGPEKTILFSALEADPAFQVTIVYLKSKDDSEFDLDERARKLGVQSFITIDERAKFDPRAIRQLLQILRDKQIDILHGHCYKSDLYGVILSWFYKMKLVTTAHGPLATFQFFWASKNWRVRYLYDQIDLRLLRYFQAVIMVSDTMRGIISRHGVDPRKLLWVRNAIDSKYFRRTSEPDSAFRTPPGPSAARGRRRRGRPTEWREGLSESSQRGQATAGEAERSLLHHRREGRARARNCGSWPPI